MNLKSDFTEIECNKFRRDYNFTPDELAVFNLRVKAHSIIEISMRLNISESTVNRKIKNIKQKIMKVLS